VTAKVISLGIRAYPIDVTVLRARCAVFDDGLAMNLTACRSRFGVLRRASDDQFLWSARLESVCLLTLASAAGPQRTRAH
jgi:hypothetical protein